MNIHDWVVLHHLDRMTDGTGLVQHARFGVPRRESGYTTDDNARALRLCTRLWCEQPDHRMLDRVTKYLSFLEHAHFEGCGFHNFMSYDRQWLDTSGTGDCQGQALRALAEVLASSLPSGHRSLAREMIEDVIPVIFQTHCLRAQAYIVLSWGHLWTHRVRGIERLERAAFSAAERLCAAFDANARPDWPWFEPSMTYANAVLPHALFFAGRRWPEEQFSAVAEQSFDFLNRVTTRDGVFWPIGNDGWHPCDGEAAGYDQQPLESALMAEAALDAYEWRRDEAYAEIFHHSVAWFYGGNSLNLAIAEPPSGGCFDGLMPSGVNHNQGAESTLAYLWTRLLQFENQLFICASGDGVSALLRRARAYLENEECWQWLENNRPFHIMPNCFAGILITRF